MQNSSIPISHVRRKPLRQQPGQSIESANEHEGSQESIPPVSVVGRQERVSNLPRNLSGWTSRAAHPHSIDPQLASLLPVNDNLSTQFERSTDGSADQIEPALWHRHRRPSNDCEDYDNGLGTPPRADVSPLSEHILWSSRWLHLATLLGFVLLFICLLMALVLLFHYSRRDNGLSTQISSNHYSWTYGPTALLVLVLSAWRQVDFSCRILAPWKHSMQGPSTASRSLLLDYISPILPTTLWISFWEHDWDVFAGALGILVLRLTIVFSTGLLVLRPTAMTVEDSHFIVNSKFIGTTYNNSAQQISGKAGATYYGIRKQGLDFVYGSAESFAYETIEVHSDLANSTITATVNGFYPKFDCEMTPVTANFSWKANEDLPDQPDLEFQYIIRPSDCPALSNYIQPCNPLTKAGHKVATGCPPEEISQDFMPYTTVMAADLILGKPPPVIPDKCTQMWSWTFANFQYSRVEAAPFNTTEGWHIDYTNLTSLACFPSYSIRPVSLTIDITNFTQRSGIRLSEPQSRTSTLLTDFSWTNFSQDLTFEYYEASYGNDFPDNLALFCLANATLTESDLFNPQILKAAAETTLQGFAAQVASQILRVDENRTTIGTTTYQEQRLQIRTWVVWAMLSCFIILVVCALVVISFRGQHAISRNPNSIATSAAIAAASPGLLALLSATKNLSKTELRRHLQHTRTETDSTQLRANSGFSVRVLNANEEAMQDTQAQKAALDWWRPLSITIPFMVWAVSLPLGVIIGLEILQRLSDSRHGITRISPSSIVDHSTGSVISSLIMIMIAMSYDSIEFGISTFGPYQTLRRGHAVGRDLLQNNVGQLPLLAIVNAVRDQRVIVALASLAATIGSLLTIIASGLYTIESVPMASNLTVTTADYFGTPWNSSSDYWGLAGTTYNLIEHENASYPSYTYKGLAFSTLTADSIPQVDGATNATMEVRMPARRASLNCTIVPKENITFSTAAQGSAHGFTYSTLYMFTVGVPDSCPEFRNLSDNIVSSITFENSIAWNIPNDTEFSYPYALLLNDFAFATGYSNNTDYNDNTIGSGSNAPGCPSLAFIFGLFEQQNISAENITAMLCVQGLEDVDTRTTFALPSMIVEKHTPPVEDERSAHWVASEDYVNPFYGPGLTFQPFDDSTAFDGFFQTVLRGTSGVPFEELLGSANEDRLVSAIQSVYREYMAQAISENMRLPYNNGTEVRPSYEAYLPDSIELLRLVQNRTSKIVLQSLLGAMLLCGMVVYASSFSLRRLLPHCPWSMAGAMCLVADSEMCERKIMPEGAEFMTDRQLAAALQGCLFSFGWWDMKGGQRYGIDVGVAVTAQVAGAEHEKRRA